MRALLIDGLKGSGCLGIINGTHSDTKQSDTKCHIDDVCERCKAIEQNPQTGLWDTNIRTALDELLRKRGYEGSPQRGNYCVMGWYGIPQSKGVIRKEDSITLE